MVSICPTDSELSREALRKDESLKIRQNYLQTTRNRPY